MRLLANLDPVRLDGRRRRDDCVNDLGAERAALDTVLGAERGSQRIAVEIKTFTGPSVLADLQQAIGQYLLYRSWMRHAEPERRLYLAVDTETAIGVFDEAFGQVVAEDAGIELLVVDVLTERIVAWRHFTATYRR